MSDRTLDSAFGRSLINVHTFVTMLIRNMTDVEKKSKELEKLLNERDDLEKVINQIHNQEIYEAEKNERILEARIIMNEKTIRIQELEEEIATDKLESNTSAKFVGQAIMIFDEFIDHDHFWQSIKIYE